MRLYSFCKSFGKLTKSELLKLNDENLIRVNGEIKPLTYPVEENDVITINDVPVIREEYVYYLYHKPRGVVCTNALSVKNNLIQSVNLPMKVFSVGRLDKESRGLLILTNDGECNEHFLSPHHHVEKEYEVMLRLPVTEKFLESMEESHEMDGKMTIPARVWKTGEKEIHVILTEGKYHQVRRLVKMSGNDVLDLFRIRIGEYEIGELKEGELLKIELKKA